MRAQVDRPLGIRIGIELAAAPVGEYNAADRPVRRSGSTSVEGQQDGRYRLLHEVQAGAGNLKPTADNVEERQAGDHRYLPCVRNQDLQDRESGLRTVSLGPGLAAAGARGR